MRASTTLSQRFAGRTLGVATMHGKEAAIAPAFLDRLPLIACRAVEGLDTDRFGTFSGEVERVEDPRGTALRKAMEGAAGGKPDLVIASEGSFVPYPPAPFITCDEEWLVLYDARDGHSWSHRHVALETTACSTRCRTMAEVLEAAARCRFPSHGLVIRADRDAMPGPAVLKGLREPAVLVQDAAVLLERHGAAWVESDLRALMNPTRMAVIRATAERFAHDLATCCPACAEPHFAVTELVAGLPCGACGLPTEAVKALRRTCAQCGHAKLEGRTDGRLVEDPGRCALCNP